MAPDMLGRRFPQRWEWLSHETKWAATEHVVALAGDAAFTCGITYEALNNIAHHTKRMIVVLNDNEWSIDKNVGAIASYLNKIVTSPQIRLPSRSRRQICEEVGGKERSAWLARPRKRPRACCGRA